MPLLRTWSQKRYISTLQVLSEVEEEQDSSGRESEEGPLIYPDFEYEVTFRNLSCSQILIQGDFKVPQFPKFEYKNFDKVLKPLSSVHIRPGEITFVHRNHPQNCKKVSATQCLASSTREKLPMASFSPLGPKYLQVWVWLSIYWSKMSDVGSPDTQPRFTGRLIFKL